MLPFSPEFMSTLLVILEVALAVIGGFIAALWISLVIWTFRDIRSRSRDIFAQLLATLLVLLFNVPGLLIYLLLRPPERLAEVYERALEEEALLQDIEERLVCPGCKRQVEPDFIICPSCHITLKKRCTECGRILHLKWNQCPYCTAIQETAEPASARPSESPSRGFLRRKRRPEPVMAPAGAAVISSAPAPSGAQMSAARKADFSDLEVPQWSENTPEDTNMFGEDAGSADEIAEAPRRNPADE